MRTAARKGATSDTRADAGARMLRVLLVDDHEMVADSLAAAIGDEPRIQVVGVAPDLNAAVRIAPKLIPDVVVLDYRLPDSDGIAGIERLHAAVSPSPAVVMLTSATDDHVLRQALAAGAVGFVSKGSSVEELVAAVLSAAEGDRAFSSDVLPRLSRLAVAPSTGTEILSERERQVLRAIARGQSTSEVAAELGLSKHTVRNHVRNILTKLGVHSKLDAVVLAAREGLLDIRP